MLIAARSSQDFACCCRTTASARSKYASAFAASGSGDCSPGADRRSTGRDRPVIGRRAAPRFSSAVDGHQYLCAY